jgi:hypothetical protein
MTIEKRNFDSQDDVRRNLLRVFLLATTIRENEEGFSLMELQQLAGFICEDIEDSWKRWGFQQQERFDQDVGDFLACDEFPHDVRQLLKRAESRR